MSHLLTNKKNMILYRGKPLVRRGNSIYYGDPMEKYMIMFTIHDTKQLLDLQLSTKVSIMLIPTENRDKPIKKAERDGLYSAIDIGEYWLNEALEMSK